MNLRQIFDQQQSFFNSNQTKDIGFRKQQLEKLRQILKKNEAEMYKAIESDFSKSEFETYATEFSLIYHEIDIFLHKIKQWNRPKRVSSGLANFPSKSYIMPEPLGTVLVIGAWNYPYQISILPALSALAAGNTVILKPSEMPANTSKVMAKLINNNFDQQVMHVIEGGVDITTELLDIPFNKIFFTGSVPVGRIVYQAAAKHLTPVTLELGGKSPAFVFADTDLKKTAQRLVWAKFLNAGQTCIAPDYVIVEKSIENKFLQALKDEIAYAYSEQSTTAENYVQIINQKNFERLVALIDEKKIFLGGITDPASRYIAPTVLNGVTFSDKIMEDEIFGPILPVIAFENLDEVITAVKERPKPLSLYVYSKNQKTIKKILQAISFGGGAVNDSVMHISNSKLPFGGVGASGIGSYHGKAGFDTFTHYKSILHKKFWFEPSIKYAPYTNFKLKLIKWFMG